MPLLPREGWHITADHQRGPSALATVPFQFDRRATDTGLYTTKVHRHPPGMTLTLQPRTLSSAVLRFLGTVPETDVLVVTHKRNMRSKFR